MNKEAGKYKKMIANMIEEKRKTEGKMAAMVKKIKEFNEVKEQKEKIAKELQELSERFKLLMQELELTQKALEERSNFRKKNSNPFILNDQNGVYSQSSSS